jgi:LacI family transcriptional regulator
MKEPLPQNDQTMTSRSFERVTLKDVARLAECSVTTASLVLAGKAKERRISEEVVERVQTVARELDYAPNLLVRSLRKGATQVIALYNGFGLREEKDLFMDHLASLMVRAAGAAGYDLLTHCDYSRPVEETYRLLNGGRSDGLIYFGPLANPLVPLLRRSRLPVVLLNRVDDEGVLSSVAGDENEGMRQIAEALVQKGHRRIAAVSSNPGHSKATERVAALQRFLAEQGASLPSERILPHYIGGPFDAAGILNNLLGQPEPPTALFCWNDETGYQMLEACQALDISVPERLSVVGYDGLHWPSTSPHLLVSINIHLKAQTETAVRLLDNIIQGQVTSPIQEISPVTLTEGTTLAPPLALPHIPREKRI